MNENTFILQELFELLLPLGNDFSEEYQADALLIINEVCSLYGENAEPYAPILFDDYVLTLEDYTYLQRLRNALGRNCQHKYYYDVKAEVMHRYHDSIDNKSNNAVKVEKYDRYGTAIVLKELVNKGNVFASRTYAFILYCGIGCTMDKAMAAHYFTNCALWGDTISQAMLSRCLEDPTLIYAWSYVHNEFIKNGHYGLPPLALSPATERGKRMGETIMQMVRKIEGFRHRSRLEYQIIHEITGTLEKEWLTQENKLALLNNIEHAPWNLLEDAEISHTFEPQFQSDALTLHFEKQLEQIRKLLLAYSKKRRIAVKAIVLKSRNIAAANAVGKLILNCFSNVDVISDSLTRLSYNGGAEMLFNQAKRIGKDSFIVMIDNPVICEMLCRVISVEYRTSYFDEKLGIYLRFKNVLPIITTDGTLELPQHLHDDVYMLDVDQLILSQRQEFAQGYLLPELRHRFGEETVTEMQADYSGNISAIADRLVNNYFLDAKTEQYGTVIGFNLHNKDIGGNNNG